MAVSKLSIQQSTESSRGFILFQYLVPQHLLSWIFGKLANCRISYIKNYLIRLFLRIYNVQMEDAIEPNPYQYDNFQNFFIRKLHAEKRPLEEGLIAPVDGSISQMGKIQQGTLIQAKGFNFDLASFLGHQKKLTELFKDGEFITFYLAPKDYHRVHFPVDVKLLSMTYIPGKLFSVNAQTTQAVPNLFARNERVVCEFATEIGPMAVVLVGAMIVGSIHTAWAGIINGYPRRIRTWDYMDRELIFKKGDELGYFTVGSTVILLFGPDQVAWHSQCFPQKEVKLGEGIGTN